MRRIGMIFVGIIVVLAVVVVGGIAVVGSMVDKAFVAEQAKSATGRDLTIGGDFDLGISLSPSIVMSDVSFANAKWGSRPAMVTLKRFEAEVDVMPFLSGVAQVNRFLLEGLDVVIETSKDGQSNLAFEAAEPAEPAEATEPGEPGEMIVPVIKDMLIKDVKVTIKDAQAGTEMVATIDVMELRAPEPSSPMVLKIRGAYNGVPFEADGELGSVDQLMGGGEAYPLKVVAKALGAVLGVDGTIGDVAAASGLNIRVSVKGASLEGTVDAAKALAPALKDQAVPPIGPYAIGATITGSPENLGVKDIAVEIGKADQLLVKADGSVANALTQEGLNVGFNVAAKDLSAIVKALALDIPKVWPFDVSGRATSATNDTYTIEDLKVLIAGSDIGGKITAKLGGERPAVDVDLKSALLDLDKLLPKEKKGKAKPAAKKAAKPQGKGDGRVFPKDPLPLDGLKAVDAVVNFTGAKIIVEGLPIENVSVVLSLQNGKLEVKPLKATVADGAIEAKVLLDGSLATPVLDIDVDVAQLDYGKLLKHMDMGGYASGKVDVDIDLASSGGSVRALMAKLDGHSKIITKKGRLEEKLVKLVMSGIASLMSSGSDKPQDLNCGVVNFTIKKGMAEATGILIDTADVSVVGLGTIDLRTEKLDMEVDPRNRAAGVTSLIPALSIGGTMGSPTALPKGAAVGKAVGKAALGIMTGGLSTLAFAAADAVMPVDQTDYCALALAGKPLDADASKVTKEEAKPAAKPVAAPKPAAGAVPAEPKDKVGGAIGGAINSLFGGKSN